MKHHNMAEVDEGTWALVAIAIIAKAHAKGKDNDLADEMLAAAKAALRAEQAAVNAENERRAADAGDFDVHP